MFEFSGVKQKSGIKICLKTTVFNGENRLLNRDVCATEGNFIQTFNSMHGPHIHEHGVIRNCGIYLMVILTRSWIQGNLATCRILFDREMHTHYNEHILNIMSIRT